MTVQKKKKKNSGCSQDNRRGAARFSIRSERLEGAAGAGAGAGAGGSLAEGGLSAVVRRARR